MIHSCRGQVEGQISNEGMIGRHNTDLYHINPGGMMGFARGGLGFSSRGILPEFLDDVAHLG
jgi:hypothetical protein